jgi:hypothetical protein
MDPTQRFSDRLENYAKFRPEYPDALIRFMQQRLPGLAVIADVGSGTGILSNQLLGAGYTVFGVEPNEPMRREAERCLGRPESFWGASIPDKAQKQALMFATPIFVVCFSILRCITGTRYLLENPENSNVLKRRVDRLRNVRRVAGGRTIALRRRCGVTNACAARGMTTAHTASGMTAATGMTAAA